MAQIFKGRVYSSSPYPSAEINYEYSRDGANMKYHFWGSVYLESSSGWYYNNLQLNLYLNGSWIYGKDCKSSSKGWSISFDSGWHTVSNKTSGTTPFYFTVKDTQNSSWCNYTSSTYNLTVAPAYATITKFNVHKRNETSVTFEWSTSNTCDYAWYSKDNGANWSALPSDNIVTGLSANTTYNFKLRVRRKDSQLTTDSGTVSQTTYDYPYCTNSPNFTIGNELTLTLYNPLNRNFTLTIIGANGTTKTTSTHNGTTVIGFNNTEWQNFWYATIPNSTEGTYQVKVTYGSVNKTRNNGNKCSVNASNCSPTFSNFTYKDINTTVTGVTENNQVLIKGLSTLEVTIPSANKMVAVNSATPKNYVISIDTLTKTVNYSTDNIISNMGTVVSNGTKRLNVRAYDSRSLSTLVYKDITVYDYAKPVINASITRLNNFEAQTTLKVSGTYTRLTIGGADKNTITNVQYRYRETGGTWSSWTTLNTTVTSGKFSCTDVILSLDNTKSFEFQIQAVDKLQTNTSTKTLDIGQAIFFVSSNKKACYINGDLVKGSTVVSPTTPTDGEDIWVKKSNNLLNVSSSLKVTLSTDIPCILKKGTYTLAIDSATTNGTGYESYVGFKSASGSTFLYTYIHYSTKKVTFTLEADAISVSIWSQKYWDISQGKTTTFNNLRIVAGSEALPHDTYIKDEMLVKNGNNIYESFNPKTNSNNVFMNGNLRNLTLNDMLKNSNGEIKMTTQGWYRIAKIGEWSGDYAYKPMCLLVHLGSDYSYYNGSDNLISICKGGSATSIKLLNSANGSTKCISAVRVCHTSGNNIYLDIYWNVGDGTNYNWLHYNIFSFNGGVTILTPTRITDSGTVKASLEI